MLEKKAQNGVGPTIRGAMEKFENNLNNMSEVLSQAAEVEDILEIRRNPEKEAATTEMPSPVSMAEKLHYLAEDMGMKITLMRQYIIRISEEL